MSVYAFEESDATVSNRRRCDPEKRNLDEREEKKIIGT